jgi:hypothetical protein
MTKTFLVPRRAPLREPLLDYGRGRPRARVARRSGLKRVQFTGRGRRGRVGPIRERRRLLGHNHTEPSACGLEK